MYVVCFIKNQLGSAKDFYVCISEFSLVPRLLYVGRERESGIHCLHMSQTFSKISQNPKIYLDILTTSIVVVDVVNDSL